MVNRLVLMEVKSLSKAIKAAIKHATGNEKAIRKKILSNENERVLQTLNEKECIDQYAIQTFLAFYERILEVHKDGMRVIMPGVIEDILVIGKDATYLDLAQGVAKEDLLRLTMQVRFTDPKDPTKYAYINTLLMPIRIGTNHWVLATLDLGKKKIMIYDSLNSDKHDKDITRKRSGILLKYIKVIKKIAFLMGSVEVKQPPAIESWKVGGLQTQKGGSNDCGAFVCRYALALMCGTDAKTMKIDTSKLRRHMKHLYRIIHL